MAGLLATSAQAQAQDGSAWTAQIAPLAMQATQAALGSRPGVRVEVVPGTLDPRLRLAPCQRIQPYLPAGARPWGATRIGVRCVEGPVAWNITMPITVRVFAPGLVAAQALPAGTVLGPEHLRLDEVDWGASDAAVLTEPALAAGRALLRPLQPGQALRATDLKNRQWFAAGDPVRLMLTGSGFAIAAEAVAVSPGVEGQPVRVRTENGRMLTGRATGERTVEVML